MGKQAEAIIRETFQKLGDTLGIQIDISDETIADLAAALQTEIDRLEAVVDTESFEFLNELALAFRRGEKNARPQHTPILEGVRAVLAHLNASGRLIPVGGMALTAEQVEDVRYDGWVGADMYMAMRKVGITEETAEAAMDYMKALGLVVRRKGVRITPADWPNPTPAEPAEEEKPVHPKPDVGDWGYGGGAAVYAPEVRGKTREELLSEKVEQLQAQVKHLSRVAVNAAEHGIKAPSGSLKPCGYCHSTEATLLHACTNCGAMTSDPWPNPTPAEPAEEETKAEDESGWHWVQSAGGYYSGPACTGGYGCRSMAHYEGCLRPSLTVSSPVVPAPTETGPWQDWPSLAAVPAEVRTVWDKAGDEYRRENGGWKFRSHGGKWQQITLPLDDYDNYAPFTTAAVAVWDPELGTRNDWTLNNPEGAEQ